ncbi:uncharacterized threonine-rich GPI-anchored glycoprotein PJ4664.02-like [Aphidius gifuensis]|uniref:uncharacterized threonine-rich GPI-anchored glycoprotein PJ4664.02-like n=1 Tax=Aphidius gifuensis TaxID=684658 RepID=UPI001CDD8F97|nr:uncharacterized threonine-rich GPI-anchored glycoprotein PJ4664.02-like [Aphidius gifuensis]
MNDKPICPDSVDCEVIEENHFKQLSHPHLDEVLKGRLEEDVTFHYVLQFKPKVRFLRYDQLVVLQKVLLEEKAASERKQLTITTQHLNTENKINNQVKPTSSQNVGTLPKVLYRDIRTLNVNKTIVEKNLAAMVNPTTSSVQQNSTVNNNLVTKQHVKTPVVNNNATTMQQISTVNNNLGSKLNFKTLVANTTASSMPQHVTYTKYLVTMPPAKTPVTSTITSQMQQNSTLNNNLVTNQHVKRPVANNNTSPMQQNSTINKTLVTKPHGNTLVVITTASPMPQPQHATYVTNSVTKPHVNTQVVSTAPSSMPQHVTYIKTLVTKPHGNTLVVITTASPMPQPQHVTYVTNSITKPHINTQVVSTPSSPMTQRVTYVTNPVTKPHVNTQVVSTTPSSMPQHVTYTKTLVTKPHVNTPAGMRTIKLNNQNFITNNSTNSTGNIKPIVFTTGVNNNLTKVSSYKVTQNNTPTPSVSELSKHSNAIVLKNNTPVTMNQSKINNKPTLQGNKIQTKPSNTQVSKFVNNTATLPIKQLIVHQPTNKNNQKLTVLSSKSRISNDSTSYKTPVNSSAQQIYISNQNTMYKLTPQMSTSKVNKKSLGSPITTTINSTSYNTPVNSSIKRARPTTSTTTTSKVVKKPLNSPITTTTDSTSYNTPVNSLNNQPIPSTSSLTYEPYYFFYSSIYNNKNTWNKKNTITFPEILDSSLGQIQSSFHITSLLNTKWLRQQYLLAAQKNDCFIIYDEIDNYDEIPNNIKTLKIKLPIGKHNSKISILNYDNGARIVMLTGSLNPHDWLNNSQGVWISPNLPYLPAGTNPSIAKIENEYTICPVIAQTSVANNLKSIESDWFHQEIIPKLTNDKIMTEIITPTPLFKFIYPTINNYKNFDDKQEWLKAYMYQWISIDKQANDAMPSINSYTKLLSGFKEIPWFILTSHNLSKGAWGYCKNPNDSTTTILNYEAGIIFFPKFLISKDTFPLVEPNEYGTPAFTLPYELPLTPYGPDDKPYVTDYISTIGK